MLDQGFGILFDAHVMEGYKFVMRYYNTGDKIFIFGFSRGAFTARFLARMICAIGILAQGNEELVRFTYERYQNSLMKSGPYRGLPQAEIKKNIEMFKATFCREHVKPHFLGLFDTVNSVSVFRLPHLHKSPSQEGCEGQVQYDSVAETATYIRHAVAIDERRVKFRPALLIPQAYQDGSAASKSAVDCPQHCPPHENSPPVKVKEVYFPGNHCDVGGGYPARFTNDDMTEAVQLSDIALNWMLEELDSINAVAERPEDCLSFNDLKDQFQTEFQRVREFAIKSKLHDSLRYRGGEGAKHWKSAGFWKFLGTCTFNSSVDHSHESHCTHIFAAETLPLARLELIQYNHGRFWQTVHWPPNYGDHRDIPAGAEIHPSVVQRIEQVPGYQPKNQGLDHLKKKEN